MGVTLSPHFTGFSVEGDFVAKTDANFLQILDRVTLEPRELRTYAAVLPELDGQLSAAHPGNGDGELYNYVLGFGKKPGA